MTGIAIGGQFNEGYGATKPAQTSDCIQPPKIENSFSISPVQHENTIAQHVRFNVHELRGSDIESGLAVEEQGSLPEVIVLSSDEEGPPKPKRAKPFPSANNTNSFSAIESSSMYTHPAVGEPDLMNVLPQSNNVHETQNLNDSLEEFEMLPPLECPLDKVQSATSVEEERHTSMDRRHPGELVVEQSISVYSQMPNQNQSTNDGIYGDFNTTFGDQNDSATVSTPSYLKRDSLFNPFRAKSQSSSNSAVGLLQSTYWDGKTPTQKQIRDSVRNSLADFRPIPGSYDPFPPLNNHVTNTARMAREYFSGGPPPPGFLAGAVVRKTPPSNSESSHTDLSSEAVVQRTPVKSLSLGREDGKMIRLQSDDRAMITGPASHKPLANYPHVSTNTVLGGGMSSRRRQRGSDYEGVLIGDGNDCGEIKGSYPNIMNGSGVNERDQASTRINRFADLKAFHQLQNQPSGYSGTRASLPTSSNFNIKASVSNSLKHAESRVVDDPWMGCGVIGPPVRVKVCMYVRMYVNMGQWYIMYSPCTCCTLLKQVYVGPYYCQLLYYYCSVSYRRSSI